METIHGKTPLTIHAARRPALSKDGGVTPPWDRKVTGHRIQNHQAKHLRAQGVHTPKRHPRRDSDLLRQRLPPLGCKCPTRWCCTARGYSFNAGFITPNNHKAHSAQRQQPHTVKSPASPFPGSQPQRLRLVPQRVDPRRDKPTTTARVAGGRPPQLPLILSRPVHYTI